MTTGVWGRRTTPDINQTFSEPPTCNSKPGARVSKWLNTVVSTKGVKPVSSHLLKSRVSNIHPIAPIKTAIHSIKPIKPGTTMGKPLPSHWRSTSTTKERPWSVAPLRLKTATSPKSYKPWGGERPANSTPPDSKRLSSIPRPKELNLLASWPRNPNCPALYLAPVWLVTLTGGPRPTNLPPRCDRTTQNNFVLSPKPVHVAIKQ
jgi:hypothetical protein